MFCKSWWWGVTLFLSASSLFAGETNFDVVIVGATPAGVATAVSAARSGATVLLLEEKNHVGGVLAGGLTNTDIRKQGAVGGLFDEFRRRVVAYYTEHYGADSPQVKDCRAGNQFEAHVAELVFNEMLKSESRIQLRLQRRLRGVHKEGKHLRSVVMEDATRPEQAEEYHGRVFVDATYEGDLAALAGVPYRVGREARGEYNEPQAGRIYARFSTQELQPGSTGEGDFGIEAFCFRYHLTTTATNRIELPCPPGYDRNDYRPLLADIQSGKVKKIRDVMQLWRMPNDKFEANSDHPHPDTGVPSESLDLAEENWSWPEADGRERERIFQRYWTHNAGFLWFLQHDEAVPEALRAEANKYGLPKDEFADHQHWPWQLYVREGRRIQGEYNFTQHDGDPDPATGKIRQRDDAIAVAEYPFDSHGVHKFDPAHPGVREGYFYVDHPPIPLPYGIIVPQRVEGLLVPVACSSSRVGYQAIRMEPVFMALGEAAGLAAKMSIDRRLELRKLPARELKAEIEKRGGVTWYEDRAAVKK